MDTKSSKSSKGRKRVILTIFQKVKTLKLLERGSTAKYIANLNGIGNQTV